MVAVDESYRTCKHETKKKKKKSEGTVFRSSNICRYTCVEVHVDGTKVTTEESSTVTGRWCPPVTAQLKHETLDGSTLM